MSLQLCLQTHFKTRSYPVDKHMRHICNILGFTNKRGNLDLQSQSVFLSQVSSQPLHISNYTMVFNHGSFVEELAPVSLISDALDLATFC